MTFPAPAAVPAPAGPPADMASRIGDLMERAAPRGNGALTGLKLGDVKGGSGFRLLPTDIDLEGIIEKVEMGVSQAGNTKMSLTIKTTCPSAEAGVTLYDTVTITEKALWRFKSLCEACPGTLSADGGSFLGDDSGQIFKGYVVRFRIEHSEFLGRDGNMKQSNKIKGGFAPAQATPNITVPAAGVNWQPS